MKKRNNHDMDNESSVGLDVSAFLGTVALFFAGILMSRLSEDTQSLKVPILLLIISTFAFIFSAIIYANMTGAERLDSKEGQDYIHIGNVMSEYLGLYPFVASVPMVVGAITDDNFLNISTLVVTMMSLFLYTISKFSLARRALGKIGMASFTSLIILCPLIGFIFQHTNNTVYLANGIVFLVGLGITVLVIPRKS